MKNDFPSAQKTSSRIRIIRTAILLSTIMLIIGSSVMIFLFVRKTEMTAHMKTTVTKKDAATARPDAATTTALTAVAGTEMAISHATATAAADPDPYANGRLVLTDDLATDQSDTQYWKLAYGSDCAFQDNAFHVRTSVTARGCDITSTDNSALFFNDFTLEVKMTILQGDLGGVSFRSTLPPATVNRYALYLDKDGNYLFDLYTGSTLTRLAQGRSSAFHTGYGQTNTIGLVARGGTFTWYVNAQQAGSTTDTRYQKGTISLLSTVYNNPIGNAEAAYTNLRIWRL